MAVVSDLVFLVFADLAGVGAVAAIVGATVAVLLLFGGAIKWVYRTLTGSDLAGALYLARVVQSHLPVEGLDPDTYVYSPVVLIANGAPARVSFWCAPFIRTDSGWK